MILGWICNISHIENNKLCKSSWYVMTLNTKPIVAWCFRMGLEVQSIENYSKHISWDHYGRISGYYSSPYSDVIMNAMASQITSVSIVHSTVCSGADRRKHQSPASLAFVRRIHRWPVNSPHKGTVTRKLFPFDDVIMVVRERAISILITHASLFSSYWLQPCQAFQF